MRFSILLVICLAAVSAVATASPDRAESGLSKLVLEGPELHPSLVTREVDDETIRHVRRGLIRRNPQHSRDAEFIAGIARSGSQGNFDGAGVRAALYALYLGEKDLGFYGLEAASPAVADRLETALRNIWAHNVSIDRARVHRHGLVFVVVWTDGVSPETWKAVNAVVRDRLTAP